MSRPRAKMTNAFPGCPVETTLSFLDGKWKGVILYHLLVDGTLRFSELRRRLQAVTQRMLTLTLRNLERDGLVERHYFPEVPPRVEYELTEMGKNMLDALKGINVWVRENLPRIQESRQTYDAKKP